MREILFRGKLKYTGEWVYWDVFGRITTHTGKQYILTVTSGAHTAYYYHAYQIMEKIDRTSIGQSTSLKDKNRKRIFEGDIIECWSEGVKARGTVQQNMGGLWIIYPAWQKHIMWGLCPNEAGSTDVEIIGNVHDNPELVERGVENAPDVR